LGRKLGTTGWANVRRFEVAQHAILGANAWQKLRAADAGITLVASRIQHPAGKPSWEPNLGAIGCW
jgi:hypothetical protein